MKNHPTGSNRRAEAGFTLIELSIVLVIVSVMLAAGGSALMRYLQTAREKAAEMRLEEVETALARFVAMNGRYPCPARLNVAPDTGSFGVEAVANCALTNAGGTFRATGTGGRMVRIGGVPVRSLNLPDDYAIDPWAMRILYAVTEVQAVSSSYAQNLGAISIVDTANNSVITPDGSAHYALISVGPDSQGTYSAQGVQGAACSTTAMDGENCDNDAVLRATVLYSTAVGASHFDDYITYAGARALDSGVPSGAVMAFNLNTCPHGWAPYGAGTGRAIIGTGTLRSVYNPGDRDSWTEERTYALGDIGGFMTWRLNEDEMPDHDHEVPMQGGVMPNAGTMSLNQAFTSAAINNTGRRTFDAGDDQPHENMPPYVALLYCQKS